MKSEGEEEEELGGGRTWQLRRWYVFSVTVSKVFEVLHSTPVADDCARADLSRPGVLAVGEGEVQEGGGEGERGRG